MAPLGYVGEILSLTSRAVIGQLVICGPIYLNGTFRLEEADHGAIRVLANQLVVKEVYRLKSHLTQPHCGCYLHR